MVFFSSFVPMTVSGAKAYFSGKQVSILSPREPINEQLQVHYFLSKDNNQSLPANSFRLVIVNQKKSWNKAVRVYPKENDEWFEVKCGDTTGKEAKTNSNIKFDSKIVTFNGTNDVNLECWKPGTFGAWKNIHSVKIKVESINEYIGNTVYIYFDNDEDRYFLNDANKLSFDQLE